MQSARKETYHSLDIPRRIQYGDHYFNNPYWERGDDVVDKYAGPPGHFANFDESEKHTLVELERALQANGIPGLSKMYGVTIKPQNKHLRAQNRFVVIGANGRLIWKRIAGNTLYIDGKKVSITYFTKLNANTLHHPNELLKSLKEPPK